MSRGQSGHYFVRISFTKEAAGEKLQAAGEVILKQPACPSYMHPCLSLTPGFWLMSKERYFRE